MLGEKQTQEFIKPKMIDPKEMSKEVRTKNIIHTKPTINRGPKEGENEEADPDVSNMSGTR